MKHLDSLLELSASDVEQIFNLAGQLKQGLPKGSRPQVLLGKVLTLVFEKPSLRTRVSFEAAMMQLGGHSIFLSGQEAGLCGRESRADVARVLGGYSDVIVLRTFSQGLIEDFVAHAGVPIVNGLSDERHPCQALTDLFTIQEVFGELAGKRLVFVGDGNNVAASLAIACALCGMPMVVCGPPGYQLSEAFLEDLQARLPHAEVSLESDPLAAVKDADVIYTDVWTSMGQESESDERKRIFGPYQVNGKLISAAPPSCRFMHCLPARRGNEVSDDVIDGPQSIAFQQADNRMHLAKGLIAWLLELSLD